MKYRGKLFIRTTKGLKPSKNAKNTPKHAFLQVFVTFRGATIRILGAKSHNGCLLGEDVYIRKSS